MPQHCKIHREVGWMQQHEFLGRPNRGQQRSWPLIEQMAQQDSQAPQAAAHPPSLCPFPLNPSHTPSLPLSVALRLFAT